MDNQNIDWQSQSNRQSVIEKINAALQSSGMNMNRNVTEMENTVFQKSRSRDEYLGYVTKLIIHVQNVSEAKNKKQPETMPDPINALQNLASQGTRNPMPGQMMPMGAMNPSNVNPNANVLQNLIHQRQGQQPMQGMPNMSGVRGVPGNPQAIAANMPPGAMNVNNMGMGGVMNQQQAQNASAQIPNNMVNSMNQMGGQMPIREMNVPGPQINPINNMMSMNMNQSMQQSQINSNINQSLNPNQMSQMLGRINPANINPHPAAGIASQMNSPQMINQMGGNSPANLPNAQSAMNPNIIANQNQAGVPPNPIAGNPQINMNQMLNPMGHMGRNPPPNVLYQVRNTAPNQPYFRKSPSPSVPSPMGANHPNQMVPSPALVPSPQIPMPTRNVMAPSPSSTNLNTPGQSGAAPSPLNPQDEQLYREKYRQLTKYIEPLKRMVARIGNDDEKLLKMNKLLEILCNPNQRIPLETLMKCEIALEKMDLKSYSLVPSASAFSGGSKEHHMNNALLEAVGANLQSPIGNHTLQRTFRPCLEALFGPDIKNFPPAKQRKIGSSVDNRSTINEIPHILQGEIVRLDQKFQITFDPNAQLRTKTIKLMCTLDDKYLPCVPPVIVSIPEDYPTHSPSCNLLEEEYNATPFLSEVQRSLSARISKLPKQFSLSHLLDTWEMSVRQACSPNKLNTTTATGVLLGI